MLVSYLGFFRILRQADSKVIPGSAGKEVESETGEGRKPVRNALSRRLPLGKLELSPAPDRWGTVCIFLRVAWPQGWGIFILCSQLSLAEICFLRYFLMTLLVCPQGKARRGDADAPGKTPQLVLEQVLSRSGCTLIVSMVSCYCYVPYDWP